MVSSYQIVLRNNGLVQFTYHTLYESEITELVARLISNVGKIRVGDSISVEEIRSEE